MTPPDCWITHYRNQLARAESKWIPMGFDVHVLHQKTPVQRKSMAKSNRPGLYVIPYSLLRPPVSCPFLGRQGPGA